MADSVNSAVVITSKYTCNSGACSEDDGGEYDSLAEC
jgi:hypothetical protein